MEALLIKERYKVTHVLYAQENYAALEAVDIQSREKLTCLLNVYEGAYCKPYIRVFHALRNCDAYRENRPKSIFINLSITQIAISRISLC